MEKFDLTESLDQILFISMLQIWNHRYSRYFLIIICIGLEPILFYINMDVVSSSKAFSTFDYMFLSIV